MGLFSSIAKIFKSSKEDVNKVLDTLDPPATEEPCCVSGQCTCGAAEQADEVISDILNESTIAAQKENQLEEEKRLQILEQLEQKEQQKLEELKHEAEAIRDATQPGRVKVVEKPKEVQLPLPEEEGIEDGDGSGPIKFEEDTPPKPTIKRKKKQSRAKRKK